MRPDHITSLWRGGLAFGVFRHAPGSEAARLLAGGLSRVLSKNSIGPLGYDIVTHGESLARPCLVF